MSIMPRLQRNPAKVCPLPGLFFVASPSGKGKNTHDAPRTSATKQITESRDRAFCNSLFIRHSGSESKETIEATTLGGRLQGKRG